MGTTSKPSTNTRGKMDLAGTKMTVIDLFRVEDGLIVEHWDVMEEILPEDQWMNFGGPGVSVAGIENAYGFNGTFNTYLPLP